MHPSLRPLLTALSACLALSLHAQIHYTLSYTDSSSGKMRVTIEPAAPLATPVVLIMPRGIPGNYGIVKYDLFVEQPTVYSTDGSSRPLIKNSYGAPRWRCADTTVKVKSITYEIDLKKMDSQLHSASDKSIVRSGFAGLLNYSLLGWIENHDREPTTCTINSFVSWPIFSTLAPTATPAKGTLELHTPDYYTLADAQTYLGPRFRVKAYSTALKPLFVVDYTEGREAFLDDYAWEETKSMAILKDYFGQLPFPCYTVVFRHTIPGPDDDPGNFGMEHLQSSTFFGDTTEIDTGKATEKELLERMPTYLHHMAHAFIPLRCYGDMYRPYVLEIPPVIHNIWFTEGFMWYIVADTLKQQKWMDYFNYVTYKGPTAIRAMSLQQLSETASTQYAEDFRLGTAIYSRGALMAAEINDYVKKQTSDRSSMKTIYRYLYEWSLRNGRPFTMEEFPGLLTEATGVDISLIYNKWQKPITGSSAAP